MMKREKLTVYDADGTIVLEVTGLLSVHEKADMLLLRLSHAIHIIVNRKFTGSIFIDKDWTFTIEEV